MESQDPNNWQLSLSQLPLDLDQPLISRRHTRDEAGAFKCRVQLQTEPDIPQFSLLVLRLENKALVIVLKFEPILSGSYQMVFEGCFENNVEEQTISHISSDGGHRFWPQGPRNLLTRE